MLLLATICLAMQKHVGLNWKTAHHCWIRYDSANFGGIILRAIPLENFWVLTCFYRFPGFLKVWTTIVFIDPEPSLSRSRNSGRGVYVFNFSVNEEFPAVVLAPGVVGLSFIHFIYHLYIYTIHSVNKHGPPSNYQPYRVIRENVKLKFSKL